MAVLSQDLKTAREVIERMERREVTSIQDALDYYGSAMQVQSEAIMSMMDRIEALESENKYLKNKIDSMLDDIVNYLGG